jgi:glycosyltransferase involved in cell wall biosynthesis
MTDPLRIAYLVDPNELLARDWMAFFADLGHEITLIVRHERTISSGLDPRIAVQRMQPYAGRFRGRLALFDARRAITAALRRIRPDVLHVHDMTSGFGWTARISGFHPYVITTWGSDVYLRIPGSRTSRLVGRFALAGADLVTMETEDVKRVAIAAGARPERCRIIQFGVDTSSFLPGPADPALRAELGLEGRRVLFSPRQIAPNYDHLSVIQAAAGLPDDVVVLMSAKNAIPDELRRVEETARTLGIEGRLKLVPSIVHEQMAAFQRLADVVVSVPLSDSISVTVLEAMACGRPIVATDLASPREWLADVWPEFMVPAGDVAALTSALRAAFSLTGEDLELRVARARQIVIERGERRTNLLLMDELYRSLVPARTAAAPR